MQAGTSLLDIIFTGPDRLYQFAGGFSYLHTFPYKIRAGNVPSPERPSQENGIDQHFIQGQTGDLRSRLRSSVWVCVPVQISHLSALNFTVQFSGSMGACARKGAKYSASTIWAARWSASSGLPVLVAGNPPLSARCFNSASKASLLIPAPSPRVPLNLQCIAAFFCRPVISQHRDTAWYNQLPGERRERPLRQQYHIFLLWRREAAVWQRGQ